MQSYQDNGKSAGLFEKPANYRYQDTDDEELASINRQVINQNQQNNQPMAMHHPQVQQQHPGQMQHFSSEDSNNLELKLDASPEMEMMTQSDMKSDAESDGPQTKIFVGGLSWQTTTDSLISYFQSFGEIKEAMVMKDPQTQRSRGFGFVTFEEEETVNEVIRFGKHEIDGKSVDPKIAFPKRGQPKMVTKTKKIFVGGLSSTTVQDDIHKYFSKFGEVDEAMLMFDRQTNRHRGFGFVTFVEEDTVDRVCEIHFHEISGKRVECKKAQPKEVMMPALQRAIKARAVQFTGYIAGPMGAIPAMPIHLNNGGQIQGQLQHGQLQQGHLQNGHHLQQHHMQAIPLQIGQLQNIGQMQNGHAQNGQQNAHNGHVAQQGMVGAQMVNGQLVGGNMVNHQQFAYVLPQGMAPQYMFQNQAGGAGQQQAHTQAYATYPYPLIYQNGTIPVMAQMPQNQAAVPVTSESGFQNAYQPQQSPLPQTAAGAPAAMLKPMPMTTSATNATPMASIWRQTDSENKGHQQQNSYGSGY